jgi:hypothetical protein
MGWLPAYDVNAAAPGLSFLITWRVLVLLLVLLSLFTYIHFRRRAALFQRRGQQLLID